MGIQHKTFEAEIKSSNEADLIVEHFISTEAKDRGGDIMRSSGMRVAGRPVVLFQHGRDDRIGKEPIAKNLSLKPGKFKDRKGIIAETQFFPDELGRRLWKKNVEGYMPNWSIGYVPVKTADIDNRGMERDITEWDLLEYSLVAVPMNADAQTLDSDEVTEIRFKVMSENKDDVIITEDDLHNEFNKIDEAGSICNNGDQESDQGQSGNAGELTIDPSSLAIILTRLESLENKYDSILVNNKAEAVLHASPDAGEKNGEATTDNPPAIPKLRIVNDAKDREDNLETIKKIVREVLLERASAAYNKLTGKVT